jgi:hypothetical protein
MDDAEPKVYRPQMFVNEPWYSLEPLPATSWLIKDFLPEGTLDYPYLMVIGGDPGSYKTTVLAAVLGSLTTRIPFLGRKVKQRETLLVAGEDPDGAKKRGRAVFTHLGFSPKEVRTNFFKVPVNLSDAYKVRVAAEDIRGQGMVPKVIAFDTMFACSEGADLATQLGMINVLNNCRRLCQWVGATNAILPHHNTKSGLSLFGSVGLPATVDVIISCKNLGGDTVEIGNERMKMARVFPTFNVKLTPVMISALRDDEDEEGKTGEVVEEEWLVVANDGPAARRPAKEAKADAEMELMEAVLRGPLGNSGTNGRWRAQMEAVAGWSEATFNRMLTEFKRRHPELAGGQWQGDPYSLPTQPDEAVAARMRQLLSTLTQNHSHPLLREGGEVVESGFMGNQPLSTALTEAVESGSSQGRAEGQDSPEDELAEMMKVIPHSG